MSVSSEWYSPRMEQNIGLTRWGHYGAPVLVFPTAGGDAGEIERNHLVSACGDLLEGGRVKLYSCDSVAGQAMVSKTGSLGYRMWLLNQFHASVINEIVPAIHADLGVEMPVVAAGASIGAFNALAVMCRYPQSFQAAICMSGTYRIERFFDGQVSDDLYFSSPVHFLPDLEGPQLEMLRGRFALIASGQGAWEDIGESWHVAGVLGRKGVPNRVDPWGSEWPHEWPTWCRMLPQYLDEVC